MNSKVKILLVFVILILIIISCLAITYIDVKGNDEWSNNTTLIVEVGVGIVVTLLVLMITISNEHKMDTKISNVLDIVRAREDIQNEKEKQVYSSILSSFKEIQNEITCVLDEAKLFEKSENDTDKKTHKDQIILNCKRINHISNITFDDPNKISSDFLEPDTIEKIKMISTLCKNKPTFSDDNKTTNVSFYNNLKNIIEPTYAELNMKVGPEINSDQIELEENIEEVPMFVSSDRSVYPLNSIMHVRARLTSVIKNEKIIFKIFNSKRKLLLSQTIDPEKNDYPELAKENLFQACFKMYGDEWKIGETYIVRAAHRSSFTEDLFSIEQRTPIIQSDKSVYRIGEDMIITVIDPDADKDNETAEFVGNQDDSKITLESRYGKIDGYQLKETDNSTGVFQGIIRILGIRKNGTVIPQNFNGKTIDKIQGTGIDDGFIGGKADDKITIIYKNNTNVVSLPVSISSFNVAIELDQEAYLPTDKVFLTVVAPDFSFNSKKIDEIGQKLGSIIQIRTSIDRFNDYKLVETGTDTGIFTGELQLIPIDKKSLKSKSRGPNDGILGCREEDFIEISLFPFEGEPIVRVATVNFGRL